MRRVVALVALAGAALAVGAAPAGATNECRGLRVCVPVAGPWVVVPTARVAPRPETRWVLTCPRGYVVGGLDAEVSDPAIDLSFLGSLGSPVNPGITTSRAAVFVAVYAGSSPHAPSFRPHVGCMPAAGGGGRVPTSAFVGPGGPTIVRTNEAPLRPVGAARVVQACAPGETLVGGWSALGFRRPAPPGDALAASVRVAQALAPGRVVATVRAGAPAGARPVVQVAAVCAGGK